MTDKDEKELTTESDPIWVEQLVEYLIDSDTWIEEVLERRNTIIKFLMDRHRAFQSYLGWIIWEKFDGQIQVSRKDAGSYVWQIKEDVENIDDEVSLITIERIKIPDEQDD